MNGSVHFQVYEHNLRRILLLDWIRNEQIRRYLAAMGRDGGRSPDGHHEQPFWIKQAAQLQETEEAAA